MDANEKYMRLALDLAKKGTGYVSPNPLVGCVIVKNGKIIGKGYHQKAGTEHAEIHALKAAGKRAKGATMYITLEPCSHFGKTPPCTDAIINSKVRNVVIAMRDVNPKVNGIKILKSVGIKIKQGILEKEGKRLNEFFIKHMSTKMPFVILKLAMTLDGKIATPTGDSKYITSIESRKAVHALRHSCDAVMVGINTVLNDDPLLDTRLINKKNPLKVIVDSKLRIPNNALVFKDPKKVIIATTKAANKKKMAQFQKKGSIILTIGSKKGLVDLKKLMQELGKRDICSILLEGGSQLAGSALKEKIIDKVIVSYAPKLIGEGIGPIRGFFIPKIKDALTLKDVQIRTIGDELLVEGYP